MIDNHQKNRLKIIEEDFYRNLSDVIFSHVNSFFYELKTFHLKNQDQKLEKKTFSETDFHSTDRRSCGKDDTTATNRFIIPVLKHLATIDHLFANTKAPAGFCL